MEFNKEEFENAKTIFLADEVKNLDHGTYVIGKIIKGSLSVWNKLICFSKDKKIIFRIKGIEKLNQTYLRRANEGDIVGLKIKGKNTDKITANDYFIIPGKTKHN